MEQNFTIDNLKLIQDEEGYGVAQANKAGEWEVVATFKYPLDALEYFTKYSFTLAELAAQQYGMNEEEKK